MSNRRDNDGQYATTVTCFCGWSGIVYYNTCPPMYCSNACKQRAYRERKRAKLVTNIKNESVTGLPRQKIERAIDSTLHLMYCPTCKRSIWTVQGNITVGGLTCSICNREFVIAQLVAQPRA